MSARLVLVSEPLPECPMCDRPVRRTVYEHLGMCSECHDEVNRIASLLPPVTSP